MDESIANKMTLSFKIRKGKATSNVKSYGEGLQWGDINIDINTLNVKKDGSNFVVKKGIAFNKDSSPNSLGFDIPYDKIYIIFITPKGMSYDIRENVDHKFAEGSKILGEGEYLSFWYEFPEKGKEVGTHYIFRNDHKLGIYYFDPIKNVIITSKYLSYSINTTSLGNLVPLTVVDDTFYYIKDGRLNSTSIVGDITTNKYKELPNVGNNINHIDVRNGIILMHDKNIYKVTGDETELIWIDGGYLYVWLKNNHIFVENHQRMLNVYDENINLLTTINADLITYSAGIIIKDDGSKAIYLNSTTDLYIVE